MGKHLTPDTHRPLRPKLPLTSAGSLFRLVLLDSLGVWKAEKSSDLRRFHLGCPDSCHTVFLQKAVSSAVIVSPAIIGNSEFLSTLGIESVKIC